jgi:uncharacterized membrane protein
MSGWSPLVAAHATAATTGLLLGGYQLVRKVKGDLVHRRLGWTWVALMTFVATSSFLIRDLRHGQLSLLHILSAVTLVSLILGIVRVRHGNIAGHRAAMRGSWYGLLGAFIGAVAVPDRLIPTLAVTRPLNAISAGVLILLLTAALIGFAKALPQRSRTALAPAPPDIGRHTDRAAP